MARVLDGEHARDAANPMAGLVRGRGKRSGLAAAHGGADELMRAKQSEKEKEKGAGELPHLYVKLRGGEIVDGEQWNGGAAWSSKLQQWRRRGN